MAPDASMRPRARIQAAGQEGPGNCPFCPGNERVCGNDIYVLHHPSFLHGANWSLRVVPNRVPLLRVEASVHHPGVSPRTADGLGAHEIIIETSDHELPFAAYPVELLTDVIRAWRDRIRDLMNDGRFASFTVHRTEGLNKLHHPHSQLFAYPALPGLQIWKPAVTGDTDPRRLVVDHGQFEARMDYAQEYPFETRIRAKDAGTHLGTLEDLAGLARIVRDVWRRLEVALQSPPVRLAFRVSRSSDYSAGGWEIIVRPELEMYVPENWETGFPVNPVKPETGAEVLRNLSGSMDLPSPDYLLETPRIS